MNCGITNWVKALAIKPDDLCLSPRTPPKVGEKQLSLLTSIHVHDTYNHKVIKANKHLKKVAMSKVQYIHILKCHKEIH